LDELIKSTEAAYASEQMPKDVSAAQTALRQHNDARNKLQQLINFTSDEADQIIIRVRQQVREILLVNNNDVNISQGSVATRRV